MSRKYMFRALVAMTAWIGAAGCVLAADAAAKDDAIRPKDKVIQLFNGKDLTGFYTWLKDAKYEDPRKVFAVEDGMLHVSGDGLGYLCTKNRYRDYHLVAEFRWGPRTWQTRKEKARDSGIIVHCVEPDGSCWGTFMAGIEAQIIEGGVGDFIVVPGLRADKSKIQVSLTAEVTKDRDGETVWHKGGQRKVFTSGRINWFDRDVDWADKVNFRGKKDIESPGQEWTRMEVICDGGHITQIVNGVKVNEGFDSDPTSGKILFQTELAEIFFRRLELWPLGKAPKFDAKVTLGR